MCSFGNLKETIDEYKTYHVNKDVPVVQNVDLDYYSKLYDLGILKICAVADGRNVYGFGSFIMSPIPHIQGKIATMESLFCQRVKRKEGWGSRLLESVFDLARKYECVGCYIGAGEGTAFQKICRRKFTKTNEVFYKPL